MKIVHLPIEIAGQIGAICESLQKKQHFTRGYNFFSTYLAYKANLINADVFEMGRMFEEAIQHFDLFHYHYGLTLFPNFKDLEMLKRNNKPVVMHHWGNDVRMHSVASQHNPYVYTKDSPPEPMVRRSLQQLSQYVSDAIVQDYEVLPNIQPYYRRVHVIPLSLDTQKFSVSYPSLTEKSPLVIHAPTNRLFKGTVHIEKAIEQLKMELSFRYVRVEKMEHEEAVRLYQQADIVIDQILCGSYGLLSVEAMAYGKPVIAYVRPDLLSKYDMSPPIVNANPDTIYDVLRELLLSPEKRVQAGMAGREYVMELHDSKKVAEQLVKVYQLALEDAKG